MIRLRFVTSSSFVSKAIRQVTWAPISHVEFCVPGGYLGAHPDGVKIKPVGYDKGGVDEIFGTVECSSEIADKVMSYAYAQLNKPYDFSAIFGILLHRDIFSDAAWICSELVAACFQHAGYPLLNLSKVNRVSPGMLLISPLITYDTGYPYLQKLKLGF